MHLSCSSSLQPQGPGREKEFPGPAGESSVCEEDPEWDLWNQRSWDFSPALAEAPLPPQPGTGGDSPFIPPGGDRDTAAPHPVASTRTEGFGRKIHPRRQKWEFTSNPQLFAAATSSRSQQRVWDGREAPRILCSATREKQEPPRLLKPQLCCSSRTFSSSQPELPGAQG